MPTQFDPPSGTRDFLAGDLLAREHAFEIIRSGFARYGFEPLQTPAFERLEVLTGKYGDEGDKLIFKILRRGEHEVSGDADLALRYDLTVPLARVAAAYGSQLPAPYKRYAIGAVWRADRPGKGRYREFVQCDLDTLGSASRLADAEIVCAVNDVLTELGIGEFTFLLNSRQALSGLLEAFGIHADLGSGALITLDKLDKLAPDEAAAELCTRGLSRETSRELVDVMTGPDAAKVVRAALENTQTGTAGLAEVDRVLQLTSGLMPPGRIVFTPRLVRGLSYYTGPIWEVVAPEMPGAIASGGRYDHLIEALGGPDVPATGGSLGIERILPLITSDAAHVALLDVAVTVMSPEYEGQAFAFAAAARGAGLRASVYLGSSGKLSRQLKWASDRGARWCLIYGGADEAAAVVTVRDMSTGDQARVPIAELPAHLRRLAQQ